MKRIPIGDLEVKKRQRSKVEPAHINELKKSILERGLFHPPVVRPGREGEKPYVLVIGECRLRAIEAITNETESFHCDGHLIIPGEVPVTMLEDLSIREIMQAELDENIIRLDLDWKDRVAALAAIHDLRKSEDPTFSQRALARELDAKVGKNSESESGTRRKIRDALIISEHLDDPKIAGARNEREAKQLILKKQEDFFASKLVERRIKAAPDKPEIEIVHADLRTEIPRLQEGTFDLILADPPYGIGVDGAGFRSRSSIHHHYEDTSAVALEIAQSIITNGWRVAKIRSNLFLFCDIEQFVTVRDAAARMGWECWRTPIIWQKSYSEGLAPWGERGFRRTYECLLWATKGRRFLNSSPVDILDYRRVSRSERQHGAEKPLELLSLLIEVSTLPGDSILDPCCGSGSTLLAAKLLKRKGVGIEADPDYYKLAMANVLGRDL